MCIFFSSLKLMGIRFGAIVAHCMLHLNVETILFHHKYLEQNDIYAMEFSIRVFNSKCILWKYVNFFSVQHFVVMALQLTLYSAIFFEAFLTFKKRPGFFFAHNWMSYWIKNSSRNSNLKRSQASNLLIWNNWMSFITNHKGRI